jgi:hypothetical protein
MIEAPHSLHTHSRSSSSISRVSTTSTVVNGHKDAAPY